MNHRLKRFSAQSHVRSTSSDYKFVLADDGVSVLRGVFEAHCGTATLWNCAVAWSDSFAVHNALFGNESQSVDRWQKAMNKLQAKVGSHETTLASWDEAKRELSEVISFPSLCTNSIILPLANQSEKLSNKTAIKKSNGPFKTHLGIHSSVKAFGRKAVERYTKLISSVARQKKHHWYMLHPLLNPSIDEASSKPKFAAQTIQYMKGHNPSKVINESYVKDEGESVSCDQSSSADSFCNGLSDTSLQSDNHFKKQIALDELMDQLMNQRITATERHENYEQRRLQDLRIQQDMAKKEREKEAAERAQSLLRPLSLDEKKMIKDALYGDGDPHHIMARHESDTILRESIQRLRPGKWLNDEVIHYFYIMLANRDAQMVSSSTGNRKRCHFFKSFFITKLLDEGVTNCYTYNNVRRWSKNVPGKDVFALDKIFIPVNMSNVHWACVVVFLQERKIQFFDSMGGDGMYYMKALLQYLKDEWAAKNNGQDLPHSSQWKLVTCTPETPKQENGFDCGVFTCMFADFLSAGYPLAFSQDHITRCRERIVLSILKGYAID